MIRTGTGEMDENSRYYVNAAGRPVVEVRFHVRYFETDAMGIVHHASYLTWFEEGRSAYTRAIGYPYSEMEADGALLAVSEISARYHRPARYDDLVIVATCLEAIRSRGLTFSYEVRRVAGASAADGELLVTGSTSHITIDGSGAVIRFPDAMRERLLATPSVGARPASA